MQETMRTSDVNAVGHCDFPGKISNDVTYYHLIISTLDLDTTLNMPNINRLLLETDNYATLNTSIDDRFTESLDAQQFTTPSISIIYQLHPEVSPF